MSDVSTSEPVTPCDGLARTTTRRDVVVGALGTLVIGAASLSTAPQACAENATAFGFETVKAVARSLSQRPFDPAFTPLPPSIANLDYDAYRDIRFRKDKALLAGQGPFRMELMHRGFLFARPVQINIVDNGKASRVAYTSDLFDFGRTQVGAGLAAGLGFAGLRLMYPLNSATVDDELISFLGASYFRFLSSGQTYGLSARALAIDSGLPEPEEFPFFREFWIEQPSATATSITLYAVIDSPSVAGAYQFVIEPGRETAIMVETSLVFRRAIKRLGVAPLTSMFLFDQSGSAPADEFRPQVHDSDGVLLHVASGEWIWRPLDNPDRVVVSSLEGTDIRGFGLMQRDRRFADYQDLEASYQKRPSYWVEPRRPWGSGKTNLLELPAKTEATDNVGLFWTPDAAITSGTTFALAYRITAIGDGADLHSLGRVHKAFQTVPAPADTGRSEADTDQVRRFLIDFKGGDLAAYKDRPGSVTIKAATQHGRIVNTALMPNPEIGGFRAMMDVQAAQSGLGDVSLGLTASGQPITEVWQTSIA